MTNETKQTAVEWLESIIIDKNGIQMSDYFKFTFQQAKEMEKEQMKIAYEDERPLLSHYEDGSAFEAYYNETYGGNK